MLRFSFPFRALPGRDRHPALSGANVGHSRTVNKLSERGVRDNLGGPEVGQVVLPATPGGSPAAREGQANVPLTRNNDLPYGFYGARRFFHGPANVPGVAVSLSRRCPEVIIHSRIYPLGWGGLIARIDIQRGLEEG